MRQISSFLGALLLGLFLQTSGVYAQSINTTLGTVTGVCVGDTVVVPVTVTVSPTHTPVTVPKVYALVTPLSFQ